MPVLVPGDIFVTRNRLERDNRTPGYWNHTAVYVGGGMVVEAQEGLGVIYTPLKEFWNRYPTIGTLRPKQLCIHKQRAMIQRAKTMVGVKYNQTRSIWFIFYDFSSGNNCVSVVRTAYSCAFRFDPGWRIPDDIASDRWHLTLVGYKYRR